MFRWLCNNLPHSNTPAKAIMGQPHVNCPERGFGFLNLKHLNTIIKTKTNGKNVRRYMLKS